jgi:hypothetical protein
VNKRNFRRAEGPGQHPRVCKSVLAALKVCAVHAQDIRVVNPDERRDFIANRAPRP